MTPPAPPVSSGTARVSVTRVGPFYLFVGTARHPRLPAAICRWEAGIIGTPIRVRNYRPIGG